MRVLVMGGGVVGVTTAYQLQRDGHEVVLIERNADVAAETSWGNAGMIAPGHSFVWSSPKAPMILLQSLVQPDQALRFPPLRRSAPLALVGAFPRAMHAGPGGGQHAAQAPDRHLFAANPAPNPGR